MTSQAVYCLSLQIRPPTEEGSSQQVVATSSGGNVTVSGNELTKMVTTTTQATAPGGAIITGLDSKSVTITEAASRQLQFQTAQAQQSQQQQQPQQHSNIILVRGSRSENGQIILQNTHELLSLLSDEDKPILLQHQRLKAKTLPEVTTASTGGNTILFQQAIKSNVADGTILLQSSDGLKKTALTAPDGGSIFLQQRLNKNGSTDGPILLRTLKRIDKSQSILVIRNATHTATATANANASSTSTSASVVASAAMTVSAAPATATIVKAKPQATVLTVAEDVDIKKEPTATVAKLVPKPVNMPLGTDGEPIKLPENLESLPRADHFPTQRHRWNTNEEIAAILISFDKHSEWQSKEVKTRPKSGSMLLYSRKKVRYRRDGYCWKKRKDGKTTREDHMKLKVQGTECIYGCYVHSAILPTFHRRCYWLLQNPDIVLVHYLNVPYPDDNKMAVITPNLALWGDKKEWTKEELVSQLKPMFFPAVFSEDEPDATNEIEISTAETVEAIVSQLMEKQRMARQSALVKQLECGCPDANCVDGKSCSHPMRRISAAKSASTELGKRTTEGGAAGHLGGGAGTAPNVLIGSRMYPRWIDNRQRSREQQQQALLDSARQSGQKDTPIHFQVIPTSQQQQQSSSSTNHSNNLNSIRAAIAGNHHPSSAAGTTPASSTSSIVVSSSNLTLTQHLNSLNGTASNNSQLTSVSSHITNGHLAAAQQQQQQQHQLHHHQQRAHMIIAGNNSSSVAASNNGREAHISMATARTTPTSSSSSSSGVDSSVVNQRQPAADAGNTANGGGLMSNGTNGSNSGGHHNHITVNNGAVTSASMVSANGGGGGGAVTSGASSGGTPSLVLSLSQLQGSPGSLLILNGQQQSFVCHPSQQQQQQQQQLHQQQLLQQRKAALENAAAKADSSSSGSSSGGSIKMENSPSDSCSSSGLVPKQEVMDASSSSSASPGSMLGHHQHQGPTSNGLFGGFLKHSLAGQHHDNMPFFNETLDLSQEDIQKTLSANMPLGHGQGGGVGAGTQSGTPTDDVMNGEINPMDFIENCGDNHDAVDDDVFVNLDAFDMLVEFPELELDAKSSFLNESETGTDAGGDLDDAASDLSHYKLSADSGIVADGSLHHGGSNASTITDFSPEWAYPEGGIKVLVTGPWSASSSYTVLFDSFPVPTTLVQNGVLRCYCPAHEVGVVTLQVACDGYVISNAVNFEYKSPPKFETKCEGSGNDMLYKFNLLNRLESIDEKLQIKVEPGELPEDSTLFKQTNFEDRLVSYCESLTAKMWRSVTPGSWLGKHRGMTLLHLASALGYAKLVRTMLTWKAENSNVILEAEIDALSQDQDGFTPLMWACARGHIEAAVVLYKWNQTALNVKNNAQQSPLEVAKCRGFSGLVAELEKHETKRLQTKSKSLASTSASAMPTLASITSSCTTSTSTASAVAAPSRPSSASSIASAATLAAGSRRNSRSRTAAIEPPEVAATDSSPEHSFISDLFSYNDALNASNSDSCSNDNFGLSSSFNPSLSPYGDHKSGGSSTSGTLHYALENNNSNPMLSNALSPNSDSNRSHDGVFLRPGAVFSSGQSPPGARLSKRSSIDSGINMETRSSLSKAGKSLRESQRLNRTDRSMSLPLTAGGSVSGGQGSSPFGVSAAIVGSAAAKGTTSSSGGGGPGSDSDNFSLSLNDRSTESPSQNSSNLSNTSLLSPLRKMDFALWDSDAKVLTLAEQIIAAMPERIKNESEEIMSLGSPMPESLSEDTSGMGMLNDSFMEPLLDSLPSSQFEEFNFEFSDHNYRYHDVGTPCSSLSPASSGPLQSPASYSIPQDAPVGSPSPPPTTQDFTEFLQSTNANPFEKDFSNLKLTEREQRELYEAAKCIQKAYRSYKGRKSRMEEQDKERSAAVVIQNYYRRYKQYAYYRQMTQAAVIIQNGYRSYCENKRFKKSQAGGGHQALASGVSGAADGCPEAAGSTSCYYKKQHSPQQQQQQQHMNNQGGSSKEPSPSGPLKRTYSQRTQNQAARKIQQFMRQSKNKLQRERAERERQVHQRRAEYHPSSPFHGAAAGTSDPR
ncbi:calmodulin-binding transcription activator 1-like isoform X5 [Culex pipiens pallens]|uniref:calmodulin-binding transcription activator 1-like isoform X5 n=1 Tax=Culex pipiens pallens TaxID=42434 RepID=UPI0019534EDD|nr:calmodulin-binding transcription activator 1-like isoform X5 [Culex pipiens pallens]